MEDPATALYHSVPRSVFLDVFFLSCGFRDDHIPGRHWDNCCRYSVFVGLREFDDDFDDAEGLVVNQKEWGRPVV
jgi:hypothetical protein